MASQINKNELMERYFRGETTLSEERMLREMLRGGNLSAEERKLAAIFAYFDAEKSIEMAKAKRTSGRMIFSIVAGVAAVLVMAFWVLKPHSQREDFTHIVNGERIENLENTVAAVSEKMHIMKTNLQKIQMPKMMFKSMNRTMSRSFNKGNFNENELNPNTNQI